MDKDLTEKLKWCKRELAGLKQAHETGLGLVDFYSAEIPFDFTPRWENQFMFRIIVEFDNSIDYIPMCQCYISMGQYFDPYDMNFDEANHKLTIIYTSEVPNVTISLNIKAIAAAPIVSLIAEDMPYGN